MSNSPQASLWRTTCRRVATTLTFVLTAGVFSSALAAPKESCGVPLAADAPATPKSLPSASDKTTAKDLLATARKLRGDGKNADALECFRKAHALVGFPTTGLEVAQSLIDVGRLLDARFVLLSVAHHPPDKGEPEGFATARSKAQVLADGVDKRIPTLTIEVVGTTKEDGTLTLLLDGAEISSASLGTARKLDPGKHEVEVKTVKRSGKGSVELKEGAADTLKIELPIAAVVVVDPPKPVVPATVSSTSPLLYVGLGLLGAGVVAGSITGVMTLSRGKELKDVCQNALCPASEQDKLDSAKRLGLISTVSFSVAGAGAVLTVIGLLTSGSTKSDKVAQPNKLHVLPYLGFDSVGLTGSF